MWRKSIVCGVLGWLASGAAPASAAPTCSNERANTIAQQFGAVARLKMTTKPDEMGDLASEFGDVMASAAGGVTDKTCTDLDTLVRKARAL